MNNKQSFRVLVDMDDTIENLLSAWLKSLNSQYGYNVSYDDVTEWDIAKFYPTLTKEQVFEPLHNNDFWKTVEPKPDAVVYLKKLIDDGYDVYLCTSTDYRNVEAKYSYIIKKYFPYITWDKVIVTSKKQLIDADVLVDDGVHNLIGGKFEKVLMTASHNKNYDAEANGMVRVNNWDEAYFIINSFYMQKHGPILNINAIYYSLNRLYTGEKLFDIKADYRKNTRNSYYVISTDKKSAKKHFSEVIPWLKVYGCTEVDDDEAKQIIMNPLRNIILR